VKLDLSTVGISCVACGTRTTLEQAIRAGWQQCLRCQFFIDPKCLQMVKTTMGGTCPSFSQGVPHHQIQPTDIPSERILIFVKDQYQKGRVGALIESIFYTKPAVQESISTQPLPPEDESLTREEIWRQFGLVLVRRSHGKWVTWEKVGET
jgi:hypothetical protein